MGGIQAAQGKAEEWEERAREFLLSGPAWGAHVRRKLEGFRLKCSLNIHIKCHFPPQNLTKTSREGKHEENQRGNHHSPTWEAGRRAVTDLTNREGLFQSQRGAEGAPTPRASRMLKRLRNWGIGNLCRWGVEKRELQGGIGLRLFKEQSDAWTPFPSPTLLWLRHSLWGC